MAFCWAPIAHVAYINNTAISRCASVANLLVLRVNNYNNIGTDLKRLDFWVDTYPFQAEVRNNNK